MFHQNKLPLYRKLYQLIKILYKIFQNTPKQYKYSLAEDALTLCWQCLDLVFDINVLENLKKHERILCLSSCFDKLKLRLRMMQELNIISQKQFVHLHGCYLKEIGEMIGGWLKWAEKIQNPCNNSVDQQPDI
jgi:hypothetical protein